MRRRSRQAAERHGRFAEALAALMLRLKGYRVLARQWRTPLGELDLVVKRGRMVAVVEVKARAAHDAAAEALGTRQRARIGRAAAQFLAAHPSLAGMDLRFDVVLVTPWRWPVHLENAWHEGL